MPDAKPKQRVAILGGGLAGLSVAHRLARWNRAQADDESRQYDITVFDPRGHEWRDLGGKCRSWRRDPGNDATIDADFPDGLTGEHGFRFFPGFYKCVTETMAEIPLDGVTHDPDFSNSVAAHLVPLPQAVFYAERLEPKSASWKANAAARAASDIAAAVGFLLGLAWVVSLVVAFSYGWVPSWSVAFWLAALVGWKMLRWALESAALDVSAELTLPVPMGSTAMSQDLEMQAIAAAAQAERSQILTRFYAPIGVLLPGAIAAIIWTNPAWPMYAAAAALVLALVFHQICLAVYWFWRTMRGSVPFDVRPRALESVHASLMVLQIIVSSRFRMEHRWENTSWWSYIGAPKFSDRYRLVLATGLTRAFVATRAELMSARTGGGILAQLLYDINPFLNTGHAADRILDGPTSEVWIQPWVHYLKSCGVRFNEIPTQSGTAGPATAENHVLVQQLTLDALNNRISGFKATTNAIAPRDGSPDPVEAIRRAFDLTVEGGFDSYVLATGTNAAQRILGNSLAVTKHDRLKTGHEERDHDEISAKQPRPFLDGIFQLELGWMSGIVFHSLSTSSGVNPPLGHLLLMDSAWAVTVINQQPFWSSDQNVASKSRLISVNVSDWFTPSVEGVPARFADLDDLRHAVWNQLRSHMGSITGPAPAPGLVIRDEAIAEDDPNSVLARFGPQPPVNPIDTSKLENLPLTNGDRLLINTARSWQNRPTATTTLNNLYIAGDHVRTHADFASMESADESAQRAVRGLLINDHGSAHPAVKAALPPEPSPLGTPPAINWLVSPFRAVDHLLSRALLPNPLGLLAIPVGWFAGLEHIMRSCWEGLFRPKDLPSRSNQ